MIKTPLSEHTKKAYSQAILVLPPLQKHPLFEAFQDFSKKESCLILGVDCDSEKLGLKPKHTLGDGDTLLNPSIPLKDQSKSDSEKALYWLFSNHSKTKRAHLLSFAEKRDDHAIYNLHLLKQYPEKKIWLWRFSMLWLWGSEFVIPKKTLFSIFSPEKTFLSIQGAKWSFSQQEVFGMPSLSNQTNHQTALVQSKPHPVFIAIEHQNQHPLKMIQRLEEAHV